MDATESLTVQDIAPLRGPRPPMSKSVTRYGPPDRHTVTRRRFMVVTANGAGAVATAAFVLPALGFAVGSALFDRPPVRWEAVGKLEDLPIDTYVPKVISITWHRAPDPAAASGCRGSRGCTCARST